MRLRLIPQITDIDFFRLLPIAVGVSVAGVIASIALFLLVGLNYGIDFRGGTTIRTDSELAVDLSGYRDVLLPLGLGDISITQVNDPRRPNQNVTQIRIEQQEQAGTISGELVNKVKTALFTIDPAMTFPQIDSVGPKVSGELVRTAFIAVLLSISAVLFYIWLRFEWQFSVGAVVALVHDVLLTIGVFSALQIKFDLAIIAALLTIVGYSLNDTVVVFDRVRENLRKYRTRNLKEVLNLSINETLSRTVMTSATTLIALISLFVLGGDVIHGFVFAMIWGVIVGTYSSVFIASGMLLRFGVKRDWSKKSQSAGTRFSKIDA